MSKPLYCHQTVAARIAHNYGHPRSHWPSYESLGERIWGDALRFMEQNPEYAALPMPHFGQRLALVLADMFCHPYHDGPDGEIGPAQVVPFRPSEG